MTARGLRLAPALALFAAPLAAAELTWGGGLVVGAPTGEFGRHVDLAGGLSGHALLSGAGPLGLRVDASWLLYGSETVRSRQAPRGRLARQLTTDNWVAQLVAGPELRAASGRLRPYAHGFLGVGYVSTTTEPTVPWPAPGLVTTNLDDTTFCFGGGGGLLVPLGSGWALDVGARFVSSSPARYLVEGDLRDDGSFEARRARTSRIEFWLGAATVSRPGRASVSSR